ncbi:MAG: hypothetical protein OK457_08680 [Thaumarchaeota archaeon]|nr:hypothetical protein [Nitrososphaerota archaeon]
MDERSSTLMQLVKLLATLLIASASSLILGGALLYYYSLVPMILVATTFVAVVILLFLSYFVSRGNLVAINVATVLGVAAPIMSYFTPSHVGVLEQIGTGGLISLLGILQLAGFYVFPILFVVIRVSLYRRIGRKSVPTSSIRVPKADSFVSTVFRA